MFLEGGKRDTQETENNFVRNLSKSVIHAVENVALKDFLPPQPPSTFRASEAVPNAETLYPNLDIYQGFTIQDLPSLTTEKIVFFRKSNALYFYVNDTLELSAWTSSGAGKGFDKDREGDQITPLGCFKVVRKNPESVCKKALLLNYPTAEDAERGLAKSIISQEEYNNIVWANENGVVPLQDTDLGGFIEIHDRSCGEGLEPTVLNTLKAVKRVFSPRKTNGCIALGGKNLDEVFQSTSVGTTVIILP